MTAYFFRAVTSDGKVRTGTLTAENDKHVARELRRQGLTPVYVGLEQKASGFTLKLPSFGGGSRRDVLFFTQELSTLLNSGIPLDRALAISAELTERPNFRFIILDVLRVLQKEPESLEIVLEHLKALGGDDPRLAAERERVQALLFEPRLLDRRGRDLTEGLAVLAAATLLRAHAPAAVADAFGRSRLAPDARRQTYGQGLERANTSLILDRALAL